MAATKDTNEFPRWLTWQQWLERWNSARDVVDALGLLHGIFDVSLDNDFSWREEEKRTLLLLEVADSETYREGKYPKISQAAAKQLANNFFRHWHTRRDWGDSERLSFEIITALLHFFRPEYRDNDSRAEIPNLTIRRQLSEKGFDYAEQVFAEFLDRLCNAIWSVNWFQAPAAVEAMLDIMNARGKLLTLLPQKYLEPTIYGYGDAERAWKPFSEPALKKLKEIALRHAESLEEALYRGNHAAIVLVTARAALKEQERRKEKAALEAQITQAKEQLAKI